MHTRYRTRTIVFSILSLFTLLIASTNAKAETVTWKIVFYYNSTNHQVGAGSFSYDNATTDFISTNPYVSSEGFYANNQLTN